MMESNGEPGATPQTARALALGRERGGGRGSTQMGHCLRPTACRKNNSGKCAPPEHLKTRSTVQLKREEDTGIFHRRNSWSQDAHSDFS